MRAHLSHASMVAIEFCTADADGAEKYRAEFAAAREALAACLRAKGLALPVVGNPGPFSRSSGARRCADHCCH